MIQTIGNVKLNDTFYHGADLYSDGDIEEDLLQLVTEERDIMKILQHDNRWPILYHLSPVRQNIVNWYDFDSSADVLEIGSGCGAITGALSRKAKSVTCIELSKRRSMINATRNQECGNVEIMIGNFNDIKLEKKYKYITLIGVLEYANYYTDGANPFVEFLSNIKNMLTEDGKLLIAIENKYGLKYWAGYKEDHTGILFDGLEGYKNTKSSVRTFSKEGLEEIIREAGYPKYEFYYPFPDYKFPQQIFSDEYLPKSEDIVSGFHSYDMSRVRLFDENSVFAQIIEDHKFDFFSNSYFIEVSNS